MPSSVAPANSVFLGLWHKRSRQQNMSQCHRKLFELSVLNHLICLNLPCSRTHWLQRSPSTGCPAPSVRVSWPVLSWGYVSHTSLCRAELPQYSRAMYFHPQAQKRSLCEPDVWNGKPKPRLLRTVWEIILLKVCQLNKSSTITPPIKQNYMRQQNKKHMDSVYQISF